MSATKDVPMQITIADRELRLRERLRDRLELASRLRCAEHGQQVVSVSIHGRENGWFDAVYVTCCEGLKKQAAGIVKERC